MVAAVMPNGLKVSIKFTPQARDDVLTFAEDSGGAGYDYDTADLLANDLATGAARVWGIFSQNETYVQNNIGSLVSNTAANGDTVFAIGGVTVDYDYETGDITISFDPAAFDYLAEGECAAVGSFTYVIRMSNGAFSTAVAKIEITGENDGPVISAYTEGDVIEDSADPTLSDTGTIAFDDADLSDTHTVTDGVSDSGNELGGVLTAAVTDVAAGLGDGTVTWSYSVANSATQHLAEGEVKEEKFIVTIKDNHGDTVDQAIVVKVTGVNDDAAIGAPDDVGAVTEDASAPAVTENDSGALSFDDVDMIDTHNVSGVSASAGALGALTASVTADTTGTGSGGVIDWEYAVENAAIQYLAKDEEKVETFTIHLFDGTSTVDHDVTVTVKGVNDEVTIVTDSTDADGEVTEDASDPDLTDAGTIVFTDVDLSDTHTAQSVKATGTLGGTLSLDPVSEAPNAASGTVDWIYTVANANVQQLAKDQLATETFTVTLDDLNGDTVEETVSVTVKGVNDEVTIVSDSTDAAGAVAEDASNPDLTDTGTIAFTDVDLSDTHDAQAVKATGTLGGTLSLEPVSEAANAAGGTVDWTYTVANANVQHLAKDQIATETFTVTVDDLNGDTVQQTVSVTVKGVNDIPTDIALDDSSVAENSANGAAVGILSTTDSDSIDTHSYSIVGGTGSGLFAIDGSAIEVDGTLDFEGKSSYSLVIRTTDNNLAYYDETFTINVTDVNETPLITSNGGGATATILVSENTTAVTTVVAADPDLGGANDLLNNFENLTYSITGGADQLKFVIDANTGMLAFVTAPDFEVRTDADGDNIYDVVVTATDGGHLSDSQAIAVTVTDVSEGPLAAPPVVTGAGDPHDHDADAAASTAASTVNIPQGSGPTGADTIHGSNNGDTIYAGNGNDSVYGHNGEDVIFGEGASDTSLYGQAGNDTISGGQGGDTIFGGSGDDTIYGMQNPETTSPSDQADTIYGGSGSDTIFGQAGNDLIIGGYGADQLIGNAGADTFKFLSNSDTGDTIIDFLVGTDKIDLQDLFSGTLGAQAGTSLAANSVNWYYDDANDQTVVQVDDNNNIANVDMQIYLMGNQALTAVDFLL